MVGTGDVTEFVAEKHALMFTETMSTFDKLGIFGNFQIIIYWNNNYLNYFHFKVGKTIFNEVIFTNINCDRQIFIFN